MTSPTSTARSPSWRHQFPVLGAAVSQGSRDRAGRQRFAETLCRHRQPDSVGGPNATPKKDWPALQAEHGADGRSNKDQPGADRVLNPLLESFTGAVAYTFAYVLGVSAPSDDTTAAVYITEAMGNRRVGGNRGDH